MPRQLVELGNEDMENALILFVVKHVVKNRFLNTLVTGDRKRFLQFIEVLQASESTLRFAVLYL